MNSVRGIIFAYHNHLELGDLCKYRTASALPICGRYRLIDFALSGMMNAGIYNVDVLMQYGFQSLIDHLGGGRSWNMVRHSGGLHLMLARVNQGVYGGDMEALDAVYSHLENDVKEDYIIMTRGDLCANLDLQALCDAHFASGADITALCTTQPLPGEHHCFLPGADGFAEDLLCRRHETSQGVRSLETYILRREKLLEMVRWCAEGDRLHFHRDALLHMMREEGWRVGIRMHEGYARPITSVQDYYEASFDMLDPEKLATLFPPERRIATRARSDVSTYYSDTAKVSDSLIADGCIIEGNVERCILSSGVRIEPGATLKNCILLNGTVVSGGAVLKNVIADKDVTIAPDQNLAGSEKLPLVIPKGSSL